MIVAVLLLAFVAVVGFVGYVVGGATLFERFLERRAAAREVSTADNVAQIRRGR